MRYAAALLLICFSIASSAHHSRAEFADDTSEIIGVITNVIWRNPHIAVFLDVENSSGEIEGWRVETFGAPRSFTLSGVSREHFRLGDTVTIAGRVSTIRPNYILGSNALLSDGTEAVMGTVYQPRWGVPYVGGASEYSGKDPQVIDAASENRGIYRVWSIPGRAEGRVIDFPFTEEAIAAKAEWDPLNNPITRCEQPGMPVPMTQPLPFRIVEGEDVIYVDSPFFDTRRTVHMNPEIRAIDQPPSHLGFSQGRWEDGELVVETTQINYPYSRTDGSPLSEAASVHERYTLSDDQSRLELVATIVDSATFTRPARFERYYLALGEPFFAYECNVF